MRKYYKYSVNKTVTRKYYKNAFETESKLINPDGLITSASGGGGWTIYSQSDSYNEVYLMLNATANTSYPRWQAGSPNVYAYLKTPKKCVLTSYLTTQMYDISAYGYHYTERVCNCWRICGYQSESDLLSLTNGYLIDENTWSSVSRGSYKTVDLNNRKGFQYYTIQMVSNFGGGSYCSMGNTKFYVREILNGIDESEITDDHIDGTPSDYDFYEDVEKHPCRVTLDYFHPYSYEYKTAGTYSKELPEDDYLIEMYGGGSGGCCCAYNSWHNIIGGSSGAGFKGVVHLPADTYTLTVGTGGGTNGYINDAYGYDGGDTSINDLIIAGGGTGSHIVNHSIGYTGKGGTLTLSSSLVKVGQPELESNGIDGYNGGGVYPPTVYGGESLYDNTYTGYGAGGYGYSPSVGISGYIKITALNQGYYSNKYSTVKH